MRLAILTTDTLHHAYYVRAMAERVSELLVLVEGRRIAPPFDTAHSFEQERDAHERQAWFEGNHRGIADFAPAEFFADVNQTEALARLDAYGADLIVTFGTGILRAPIIAVGGKRLLNLHGGDPEHYRGLDTHLWAIWHGDFAGLVTSLHHLSAGLDEGDIVGILPMPLHRRMSLHQLRKVNTEVCVNLTDGALVQWRQCGSVLLRPQQRAGRYYSFMPAVLKSICVNRFRRFTETLS